MARKQEPLFTQMEFNNAQYAMDIKTKCEAKLVRIKLGLKIAIGAQIAWASFMTPIPDSLPEPLPEIIMGLTLVSTAAYIVGGGLGSAFKSTWRVAKKIGWFGWLCVPFPMDIFTGIMFTLMAFCIPPLFFLFLPLALVYGNYKQVKMDFDAAEEYLNYFTPVNAAYDGSAEAPTSQAPEIAAASPAAKFCANCGARLTPDVAFCPGCGTKVN